MTQRLVDRFDLADREELLRHLGVDLRYVTGPGQEHRLREDGLYQDHWGVLRRPMTVEGLDRDGKAWSWTYKHLHQAPLAACDGQEITVSGTAVNCSAGPEDITVCLDCRLYL